MAQALIAFQSGAIYLDAVILEAFIDFRSCCCALPTRSREAEASIFRTTLRSYSNS